MSRFTFPASPTVNQQAQLGARTFRWDGRAWRFIPPVIQFEDFLTQSQATNVVQPIQDTLTALTQNAPTNLDTFVELAAAINNDPSFHSTMTSALGDKADLVNGLIPAGQLPSYVEDVIEGYYNEAGDNLFYEEDTFATEITGETGKIYVDIAENVTYRWSGSAFINISSPVDIASEAEAEAGTDNTKLMTPLRTAQAVAELSPAPTIASEAEAEAGTDNTVFMTPLRTAQAIDNQNPKKPFSVVNNASGEYIINSESNPDIILLRGFTYEFNINASGHPFWIQTETIPYNSSYNYNDGVTNNGEENGVITFNVPFDAPDTLYYMCQFHTSMNGKIIIKDVEVESGTVSLTLEGTLSSSGWTGTDPKVQTINVTGILASDNPIIDIVFSGQYNTDTARAIEFNKVYRIVTGDGTLTASAIEAPLVNLPLQIKVVR